MPQPLIAITRRQAFKYASFLVLYEFLTYIANDMIMPGMLLVVKDLHGSEAGIASSLTAYIMGGASLQLFLGPLSDRFGRRPVMLTGALLFLLFTVMIAFSQSMGQFLWARFFQGMGLCFICVIGYATLQEIFAEKDAVKLIAIMANVSILAPLIGPLLGSLFIQSYSWRYIFFTIGAFALLAWWGLKQYMPEPVGQMKSDGKLIPRIPLTAKTILYNYKNLLFTPTVFFGSIALGALALPCIAWIALSPIILVSEGKLTLVHYGLWQIPLFGAFIVGNIILQVLTNTYSMKKILFIGSVIAVLSLIIVMLPLFFSTYPLWLIPGLIVYFIGLSIATPPLNRLILFSTSVGKGTTSAFISMVGMCVQGLGVEIAKIFYYGHSNLLFGFYCVVAGSVYFVFLLLCSISNYEKI